MAALLASQARGLLRPMVQLKRELSLRVALLRQGGSAPLAMFLPSSGRAGAARLRIYNVAERCAPHGWRAIVLPANLSLRTRQRLIAAAAPDDPDANTYGYDTLRGTYRESISGLHQSTLHVSGEFLLRRVAVSGELNPPAPVTP